MGSPLPSLPIAVPTCGSCLHAGTACCPGASASKPETSLQHVTCSVLQLFSAERWVSLKAAISGACESSIFLEAPMGPLLSVGTVSHVANYTASGRNKTVKPRCSGGSGHANILLTGVLLEGRSIQNSGRMINANEKKKTPMFCVYCRFQVWIHVNKNILE